MKGLLWLPVVFHIATAAGGGEEMARRWAAQTSAYFEDAGVAFAPVGTHRLSERWRRIDTVRERHALQRFLTPRRIHVFLVDRIDDPWPSRATRRAAARLGRTPSGRLGGAHIRAPGRAPGSYLLVSRRSGPRTLAHELGHFLGAGHHPDPANIMSYGPDRTHFTAHQLRVFRMVALRHLRDGTLRRASPPEPPAPPDPPSVPWDAVAEALP